MTIPNLCQFISSHKFIHKMVILSWYETIFARLYTCGSLMVSPFPKFAVIKHNLFKNILKVVQQCPRNQLAAEVTHSLIFHHPWSTWFPHWHLTCALSATLPPPNPPPQPTLLRNDTSAHNMTIPQTFLHRYTHRKKTEYTGWAQHMSLLLLSEFL